MNHHRDREHIRRHAHKHHEAHLRLKELLRYAPKREKVWHIFIQTFFVALVFMAIYANWGKISAALTRETPLPLPQTHGFKTGMISTVKIEKQAGKEYLDRLTSIPAQGGITGIKTVSLLGKQPFLPQTLDIAQSSKKGIQATMELGTGQFLTVFPQAEAHGLSKSLLATYYLGEKTVEITSALANDTRILGQISNALSVDLFAYLNQSAIRSDALDGYTNLLKALLEKTNKRISELQSTINFIEINTQNTEAQAAISEGAFLKNIQALSGVDAEKELGKFIGLENERVEMRAKAGAYKTLRDYYLFFKPKLENLINTIHANRDPLIAGVKVVEIQNMALPLIIRQQ